MAFLKCLECGIVLESKHTHDFVRCSCPNKTFLDGGGDYFRYGGMDMDKFQVIEDDTMMARIRRSGITDELDDTDVSGNEIIKKLDDDLEDYR